MGTDISITDRFNGVGVPQYRFSRNDDASLQDELIIHVNQNRGHSWYGVFPPGNQPGVATSGFYYWRSSRQLLVVSSGRGYLVDTSDPSTWSETQLSPITWYDNSSVEDLVIICDFKRVAAYMATGLKWKTPQISWGGFRNMEITDGKVQGEAWDDPWDTWVSFLVDIETGRHQGGATFSLI